MPGKQPPNIVFIMSDDHASHAISCYGSRINKTPGIDRIASDGMRFENCFCTNSICGPSRASILTGTYSHVNGVTTLETRMDNRITTFPKLLREAGYQTAIAGKWHLGEGEEHCPAGFDYWNVLPGQGLYYDPEMIEMGSRKIIEGYATDIITDISLEWMERRDRSRPFCLLCHHKAPHRPWEPGEKHARMYEGSDILPPKTFNDDYSNRAEAAREAKMRIERELNEDDLKQPIPDGLSSVEEKNWKYQRFIKDYLRCVASVDDSVGRILDYLKSEGLSENTIVVYTSDQGFFLGDHGWFDKRFMYEESLRMPLLVRYPEEIPANTVDRNIVLNVDFPCTFLDYAGVAIPGWMQGESMRSLLAGEAPGSWRRSMYYRYWMHLAHHNVPAHYGVRTLRYKLIYYHGGGKGQPGASDSKTQPVWELFDLERDPCELKSVYNEPEYRDVVRELKKELEKLQRETGDKA